MQYTTRHTIKVVLKEALRNDITIRNVLVKAYSGAELQNCSWQEQKPGEVIADKQARRIPTIKAALEDLGHDVSEFDTTLPDLGVQVEAWNSYEDETGIEYKTLERLDEYADGRPFYLAIRTVDRAEVKVRKDGLVYFKALPRSKAAHAKLVKRIS